MPLGPGGSLRYRRAVFDFRADSPLKAAVEEAPFDAVLLFDGVFLLRPELCEYWDFAIFVHADFEVTVRRAEVRDRELFGSAATVRNRYQQRYIPGQRLYLFEVEPERRANVVINNTPDHPRLVHVVRKSESRKGGENDPVNCQKPHVAYGL